MKLFGSSGGQHSQKSEPAPARRSVTYTPPAAETVNPAPRPAPVPERPPVQFVAVEPPPPPPEVEAVALDTENAALYPAPARASHAFRTGYLIYLFLLLALVAGALALLWLRMDIFERSRPYRAMDYWLSASDRSYWHDYLWGKGVDEHYIDENLDLDNVSYYKKLDEYADDYPVYSVRFGKKTMLTVRMYRGGDLPFNSCVWELGDIELVGSGLTVYAPEDAVLSAGGRVAEPECLVQRNAQPVEAGAFEEGRDDLPGLAKYVVDWLWSADGLTVTDAEGRELVQAYARANSYYYPPLTSRYVIEAPSEASVTVNGVLLAADNSEISSVALEDFAGLEGSVPAIPADLTYTIDGLVARPVVEASYSDGSALAEPKITEDRWIFSRIPDPAFAAEQEAFILRVFDAYIAFLGNRGGDMYGNLYNYQQYLVPDSEAYDRASRSLDSLYWFQGRDAALESSSLREVLRYGPDCFTAEIDFTRRVDADTTDDNTLLFIFVRYNGQWRGVRVMNKTSFLEGIT
ncbi:MAG: hypothetical protein IJ617_02530 [Oscillospiraceae bacterium]|nr:hypothetical protein [Oscillospiraceae bacterium]